MPAPATTLTSEATAKPIKIARPATTLSAAIAVRRYSAIFQIITVGATVLAIRWMTMNT